MLWADDAEMMEMFGRFRRAPQEFRQWCDRVQAAVRANGFCSTTTAEGQKLYVLDSTPTAENLSRHWFDRLKPCVTARTDGQGLLIRLRVWETPNCSAEFPIEPTLSPQQNSWMENSNV